jgi:signal transduction histidine kinase/DNA-binding CsgD family transcriptional regulator
MADLDAGRVTRPPARQAVVPFEIMRLRPLLPDVILAVVVSVPAFVGTVPAIASERHQQTLVAAAVPLALMQALPLAWRRVQPLAVLAVTVAATVALFGVGGRFFPLGVAIALYTVAAHRERPQALRAGLAALAVLAVPIALAGYPRPDSLVANVVLLALCWTVGAYLGELRARAARAEREREAEARRAVAEEHARITRELHDVIAHNVSVMVVQAAAGADVFDHSPERARQALAAIEATGRQALAELRRLLNAEPVDAEALAPQPGLARLDALAEQIRAAGLAVELRVEGEPFPLPSGADLSAYRIVQEALTNTLKHANATRASVLVHYRAGEVALEVRDDGRGGPAADDGSGHGIIGLDEYVYAAIRAGASGFLLKDVQPVQLVEAIRVVAAGDALLAPSVTRRLLERFATTLPDRDSTPPPALEALTERELEVLRLLASGCSNAELAERLFVSEATAKTHVSSILRKLGLRDRVQAAILAYDAGLVRPRG